MESHPAPAPADQVREALAAAGIVLPADDIAFLAAQTDMLARIVQAVAKAAPK